MTRPQQLKNTSYERRVYRHRITISILILIIMTMIVIGRYSQLQITDYDIYKTQSDRNRIQLLSIAPKRGLIFDRNGLLLAENIPSYTLTVVKERFESLDDTLAIISGIISLSDDDIEQFRKRLRRGRPYEAVPLKFRVSELDIGKLAVNRHRLPGVEIDAQLVRHYPQGELFSHMLGYVGRINERELDEIDPVNYSGTHHIGKIGIEKYYEELLHGTVGYQNVESNAHGRVLRVLERHDPLPGSDITLNVDAYVQRVAYETLQGRRGAIVAMEPHTGAIIAMVSAPSYDTNLFVNGISSLDYSDLQNDLDLPLFNRALQGQYPPASTIKPMWGLAGLHYGVIKPATRIRDPGWFSLPGDSRRYRDWRRNGHGFTVDLEQAVVESCDVYFYELAYKLGIDRLHSFGSRFGLGDTTGIDNTNERPGLMPSRAWKESSRGSHWYPGETINVGIGQGFMLATPLQLAVATSVVASRGDLYAPRLLSSVGGEPVVAPLMGQMVDVSDAHWDSITHSMEQVIYDEHGTGRSLKAGLAYRLAGKSGTAQVVGIAAGEEYDSSSLRERNRDHALFIAFGPASDPKIAVAVVFENGEHGGSVAGPAARKVIDAYLLGDPSLDLGTALDSKGQLMDIVAGVDVSE